MVRVGADRRPPPLARRRRPRGAVLVALRRRCVLAPARRIRAPSRSPSRAPRAPPSTSSRPPGSAPAPLTPFEALVRAGDPAAGRGGARGASTASARAVAPADWRRDGIGARRRCSRPVDGNSPAAARNARPRPGGSASACPPTSSRAGRSAQSADFVAAVYGNFPLMLGLLACSDVPAARARVPLAPAAAQGACS